MIRFYDSMSVMQCIGKLTRSDSFSMEISKDIARDENGTGMGMAYL